MSPQFTSGIKNFNNQGISLEYKSFMELFGHPEMTTVLQDCYHRLSSFRKKVGEDEVEGSKSKMSKKDELSSPSSPTAMDL